MSLDVNLTALRPTTVFEYNITHNLGGMAKEAGIYEHIWKPDTIQISKAGELIEPLTAGLALLESAQERFSKFNPDNGWGSYKGLVKFVRLYLEACKENPDAEISVSR